MGKRFADLNPCTLREWKDQILAEDASHNIVSRWLRRTPRQKIDEDLAQLGYVVRKTATVLPSSVSITRLPPGEATATPLRILRAQAEAAAARGESRIPISEESRRRIEAENAEHAAEARAEGFAEARYGGASIDEALDEANIREAIMRRDLKRR